MSEELKTPVAGALTSRLGRRFVLLFAVCALVPLIVFATLTVTRVSRQMHKDLRRELHSAARTAGMGIAARLGQIASDLTLASDLVKNWGTEGAWSDGSVLEEQVGGRCSSVWLVEGEHVTTMFGAKQPPQAELDEFEQQHLASGAPVALVVGEPPQLMMMRDTDPEDGADVRVVAMVKSDWFWDPEELRGRNCEFAATDVDGRMLYHTFEELPRSHLLRAGFVNKSSSGSIEWQVGGEPHLARYWHVFLKPQYALDMLVVQSQSRAEAYDTVESFERWFWLTAAGTLLCVILGSLVQMRRTLDPIVSLRDATRKLGRGELRTRVDIETRDEFGDLGAAFNDMVSRLQENIHKREQTERALVASRDEALAAAKAKAEFVTNVSHEFRTPMAEILGAAEILTQLESGDEDARVEFSGIALHGAQRLARLLDDVLKLGQGDEVTKTSLDIAATVEACVQALPEETRSRVVTQVGDGLGAVLGDGNQITEVWARLIDNAAKFSDDSSPIDVQVLRDGDDVLVEVADYGVGIAAADLGTIFEPFAQVGRDQMIDKAHGTGLGLTLAKAAVESHGGSIRVRSKLGEGSTFTVSLPVEAAVPTADAASGRDGAL